MKTHTEYLGNGIINIHVSFAVKRRNGRKLIITPDGGQPLFESKPVRDNTMIKVLVRAFKWRKLYESGTCPSFDALSERLKINKSYIGQGAAGKFAGTRHQGSHPERHPAPHHERRHAVETLPAGVGRTTAMVRVQ
jgi:hypothetical protein